MRTSLRPLATTAILATLLLASMAPLLSNDALSLSPKGQGTLFTQVGEWENINIGTYPNGTSSQVKVEVPEGEAMQELGFEINTVPYPHVESFTWDQVSHFNHSAAVFDNVDWNKSGLSILPQGWEWDFETSSHNWNLNAGGGWAWGYDSTLGASAGVHSGTKALYTYNGNYPNYMGATYWATSPTIDCTSCSGNWELQYWKRLGVEYPSYDHAYVDIKNAQGSWSRLFSNGGTINDGSYSQVTHQVGNYVSGNSAVQIRFGLGTTDGSVTYTGWNVDDVSLLPSSSGVSSGSANWTSPDFGPDALTGHRSMPGHYGLMSMDAYVPTGAVLEWTILDAISMNSIPGFTDRTEMFADLGSIDYEEHPSLRLKIAMASGSGGNPIVHSINLQGLFQSELNDNPANSGWDLDGATWSQSNTRISGTSGNTVTLPLITLSSPVSQVSHSFDLSGSASLQTSIDGGAWTQRQNSESITEDYAFRTLEYRIQSTGDWQLDSVMIRTSLSSLPTNPRIDVSMDGDYEWSIPGGAHGMWGHQDRLANGALSHKFSFTSPFTHNTAMLLPVEGVENWGLQLVPVGGTTDNLSIDWVVAGQTIFSKDFAGLSDRTDFTLTDFQLDLLNDALANANHSSSGEGWAFARLEMEITSDGNADILMRGVSANYPGQANFSAGPTHPLVNALNDELSLLVGLAGTQFIPVPFQTETPGSFSVKMVSARSSTSPEIIYGTLHNATNRASLTPTWHWYEAEVLFSTDEDPGHVEFSVAAVGHYAQFSCNATAYIPPIVSGGPPLSCAPIGDSNLILWHPESPVEITYQGGVVETMFRFRIDDAWDDEDSADIRIQLVSAAGNHSIPEIFTFGIGSHMGIENDPVIQAWWVDNQLGNRIPDYALYLKPGADVNVVVDLGFENISTDEAPRSDDVEVYLYEGNNLINSTRIVDRGIATIGATVPSTGAYVTWEVRLGVVGGSGGGSTSNSYQTFQTDALAPEVVSMNVARHDHLAPSVAQELHFTIHDRPVLPEDISLHLWKQWLHDVDEDGMPDADEYTVQSLILPSNMSEAAGDYWVRFDDTSAPDGSFVAGWLSGSDYAGNLLLGGGASGPDQYLFMYQVMRDYAPLVYSSQVHFNNGPFAWLHPEVSYEMVIPITEANGMSDISTVEVQLASNAQSDVLPIIWDGSTQRCSSGSNDLLIDHCTLGAASGITTPYSSELVMTVGFEIQWSLPADTYLSREPSVEVTDRASQSTWSAMPELRWRYSPDLMIDRNSMTVNIEGAVPNSEGAWVQPGAPATIRGEVVWATDGTYPGSVIDVALLLDGQRHTVASFDGGFNTEINMPLTSGDHPLNVELANLPSSATDLTDKSTPVMWIVVDGDAPVVTDILSPRPLSVLSMADLSELEVELRVKELEQLNPDTLLIHWRIQGLGASPGSSPVAEGEMKPNVMENRLSGQSIPLVAIIDVSTSLEMGADLDALEFIVWITGSDMAGNPFDNLLNSEAVPLGIWPIEQRAPQFTMTNVDIDYSKFGDLPEGETLTVSVTVHNVGSLSGEVELVIEEVRPGGERRTLQQAFVTIDESSANTTHIDWELNELGAAWIEVHFVSDGTQANGPTIRIVEAEEESLFSGTIAGVDSMYVWLAGILTLLIAIVLAALLKQGGSKDGTWLDEGDWDEAVSDQTSLVDHNQTVR